MPGFHERVRALQRRIGCHQSRFGTLGGGNHFVEVGEANDAQFLTVHSGSRTLGRDCAAFYQKRAVEPQLALRCAAGTPEPLFYELLPQLESAVAAGTHLSVT